MGPPWRGAKFAVHCAAPGTSFCQRQLPRPLKQSHLEPQPASKNTGHPIRSVEQRAVPKTQHAQRLSLTHRQRGAPGSPRPASGWQPAHERRAGTGGLRSPKQAGSPPSSVAEKVFFGLERYIQIGGPEFQGCGSMPLQNPRWLATGTGKWEDAKSPNEDGFKALTDRNPYRQIPSTYQPPHAPFSLEK
ncbi:hypothetical protein SKAU_G00227220 [Synaphobranchus kaupii]|uniref:Uncharacterized protein n=1 Tax=Synaphobranchus kaupii TaxID=118154 RepID=A0A9Q1F5D0_SYNKA|nr:hypothetical protein SKAU_G00227220 [Synaphobranchus kaupii]